MKSLIQFIKESLVNESSSDFLLLKEYEDAEKYFNEYPKQLEKFGISLEDIKHIYDIAAEYNKTAPFVGRYKSNKVFAMRRWVDSKLDEWRERSGNNIIQSEWFWTKIPGVYAGPHNTNLKEDGSYNPSAEDMESVVAFAVNKMLDSDLDDVQNIKFCTNDKSDKQTQKQENMLNYYQDEFKFINNCANVLKQVYDKLHKLLSTDKSTNEWEKLGSYKETGDKPNNTPKTDLITSNKKYKVSLKKADGSQPMSGAYNEAKATILCAAKDCNLSKEEYDELEQILSTPWTKLRGNQKGVSVQKVKGDEETKKLINDSEKTVKEVTEYLNNKLTENKYFMRALLIEAMSGNHKFGKNSNSAANCVFVWSNNASKNKFYPSIEEYVDHILQDKLKVEIGWKTGGSTSYQVLRIVTK